MFTTELLGHTSLGLMASRFVKTTPQNKADLPTDLRTVLDCGLPQDKILVMQEHRAHALFCQANSQEEEDRVKLRMPGSYSCCHQSTEFAHHQWSGTALRSVPRTVPPPRNQE